MGRDKASLPFGLPGETMLLHVVRALAGVVSEIVVVARKDQELPDLARGIGGATLRRADDEIEGRGPLGGLVPGLRTLSADVAFASSCDAPFLSRAFVECMFGALGAAEVAMPEAGGFLHPLAAVYRRTTLPHLEVLLSGDRLRPVHLLDRVAHVKVPESTLRAVDPTLASLDNVNTPEAYAAALAAYSMR